MAINSAVKSVFVAGSVGRFVEVAAARGSRLVSGKYYVSAYVSERGCRGNTVLSFRNLSGEVVAMGWREACDDANQGANPVVLSIKVLSSLNEIEKFFAQKPLLATVELTIEAPSLNLEVFNLPDAGIPLEAVLGSN